MALIQNQLEELQRTYRPLPKVYPPKPVSVQGFEFPLINEEDVELLEEAVRENRMIRDQFIRYLTAKKAPKMDLVECFSMFFADTAMVNYNWNGFSNHRFPKKAMRSYSVFTECMLEAWGNQGITPEVLQVKLKRTVEKINNRRNVQLSKLRRKAKQSSIDVMLLENE